MHGRTSSLPLLKSANPSHQTDEPKTKRACHHDSLLMTPFARPSWLGLLALLQRLQYRFLQALRLRSTRPTALDLLQKRLVMMHMLRKGGGGPASKEEKKKEKHTPSLPTKNFSKFHLILLRPKRPGACALSHSYTGSALSPLTSVLPSTGNETP